MAREKRRATGATDWAVRFLKVLTGTARAPGGSITRACRAAGICRTTFYHRRNEDETFRAAVLEALEEACDLLEDEARRRAMKCSDVLLIFLLKAHRPEKFRERFDVRTSVGVQLEIVEEIVEAGKGPPQAARDQAPTNGTPAPASRLCPGPPS
jgi:hypothetical protein